MTDKELLELAAKAAGYKKFRMFTDRAEVSLNTNWNEQVANWIRWNPITDDGDALRLAVKLKMQISCSGRFVNVQIGRNWIETDAAFENLDIYAAVRKAIVRAAAEIGKELK